MSPDRLSRRTIAFVNVAHALDHFVLLIYPTAVIAIAAEKGLSYASLIGLSTGAFVAFGLFSLPMGWFADRLGRRNLLAAFFCGCGAACLELSTANHWLRLLAPAAGHFLRDLSSDWHCDAGDARTPAWTGPRDQRSVGKSRCGNKLGCDCSSVCEPRVARRIRRAGPRLCRHRSRLPFARARQRRSGQQSRR